MDICRRIFAERFRIIFKFVSAGTGGRGVSQMWTDVNKGGGGGVRGQKSLKMCGHPLWMAP